MSLVLYGHPALLGNNDSRLGSMAQISVLWNITHWIISCPSKTLPAIETISTTTVLTVEFPFEGEFNSSSGNTTLVFQPQ